MNTSLTDEDRSDDTILEPMQWEAYFPPPVESSYAREKMDGEPLKRVMQFPIDGRLKGGGAKLAQLRIPQHPPMVMASSTKEVESMLSLAGTNNQNSHNSRDSHRLQIISTSIWYFFYRSLQWWFSTTDASGSLGTKKENSSGKETRRSFGKSKERGVVGDTKEEGTPWDGSN